MISWLIASTSRLDAHSRRTRIRVSGFWGRVSGYVISSGERKVCGRGRRQLVCGKPRNNVCGIIFECSSCARCLSVVYCPPTFFLAYHMYQMDFLIPVTTGLLLRHGVQRKSELSIITSMPDIDLRPCSSQGQLTIFRWLLGGSNIQSCSAQSPFLE